MGSVLTAVWRPGVHPRATGGSPMTSGRHGYTPSAWREKTMSEFACSVEYWSLLPWQVILSKLCHQGDTGREVLVTADTAIPMETCVPLVWREDVCIALVPGETCMPCFAPTPLPAPRREPDLAVSQGHASQALRKRQVSPAHFPEEAPASGGHSAKPAASLRHPSALPVDR